MLRWSINDHAKTFKSNASKLLMQKQQGAVTHCRHSTLCEQGRPVWRTTTTTDKPTVTEGRCIFTRLNCWRGRSEASLTFSKFAQNNSRTVRVCSLDVPCRLDQGHALREIPRSRRGRTCSSPPAGSVPTWYSQFVEKILLFLLYCSVGACRGGRVVTGVTRQQ